MAEVGEGAKLGGSSAEHEEQNVEAGGRIEGAGEGVVAAQTIHMERPHFSRPTRPWEMRILGTRC